MPSVEWTIEHDGESNTLAELGIVGAQLTFRNQASDIFGFGVDGRAFDDDALFENLASISLKRNGTAVFKGRRIDDFADASGQNEGHQYVFAGPWDYLEKVHFKQNWKDYSTTPPGYVANSNIFIPGRLSGSNLFETLNSGQMIEDVVVFLTNAVGNVIQMGDVHPAVNLPVDQRLDLKCSEVIQLMLGLSPDALCYFDYTTSPPTLHVIQTRTSKTVAMSAERISGLRLRTRNDMVPGFVEIIYEQVNSVDGASRLARTIDKYPPAAVDKYNSITQTVKLYGSEVVHVSGTVDSEPFPASIEEWWRDVLDIGNDVNVTITPTNAPNLPYFLLPGSGNGVQPWMETPGGDDAEVEEIELTATISYSSTYVVENDRPVTRRVTTTNMPPGTYKKTQSVLAAEPIPVGLAQNMYASLTTPAVEGTVVLTEDEAQFDIGIQHAFNISGGTGRFAAMNTPIQSVSVDIDSGQTTLQLGWPRQLSITDLVDLLRMNRTRNVYLNPKVQQDGEFDGSEIDLGGDTHQDRVVQSVGTPRMTQWGESAATHLKVEAAPAVNAAGVASPLTGKVSVNGVVRDVSFRELTVRRATGANGACEDWKIVVACSDYYQ